MTIEYEKFVHVPLPKREHKTICEKETISIDCIVKAVVKSIESLKMRTMILQYKSLLTYLKVTT